MSFHSTSFPQKHGFHRLVVDAHGVQPGDRRFLLLIGFKLVRGQEVEGTPVAAGRAVLLAAGIATSYDALVPHIQNRTKNGQCPMDASVEDVWEPYEAVGVLGERARTLLAGPQLA